MCISKFADCLLLSKVVSCFCCLKLQKKKRISFSNILFCNIIISKYLSDFQFLAGLQFIAFGDAVQAFEFGYCSAVAGCNSTEVVAFANFIVLGQ